MTNDEKRSSKRCSKFLRNRVSSVSAMLNFVYKKIREEVFDIKEKRKAKHGERQYRGSIGESNKLIAHREMEEKSVADSWQIGLGQEKIVESNIRRAFTVRFPNLYCVWQRCRDIRGSYRNVLLLIVPPPWRWYTIYEGWEGGVCTQGERETG